MKKNPLRFVLVEWDDAWKTSTEQATPDTAGEEHKPEVECSAGWVLRDDEEGIQLGASYSVGKRSDGMDWTHRNRSFIPRKMIVNVTEVRLTKVPQKKEKTVNAEP